MSTSHNLLNKSVKKKKKNVLNFATVFLPANLLNLPSLKVLSLVKNIYSHTNLEVPSPLLISFRTEIHPFSSPCFSQHNLTRAGMESLSVCLLRPKGSCRRMKPSSRSMAVCRTHYPAINAATRSDSREAVTTSVQLSPTPLSCQIQSPPTSSVCACCTDTNALCDLR